MTALFFSLAAMAMPLSAQTGESGTLVVANMADNTATIIDVASRKTLVTLPTGAGPHEVAISPDGKTAIVSNYGVRGAPGNSLTLFDLTNPGVMRQLPLPECRRPHSSAYLPDGQWLAVTCEGNQSVALLMPGRPGGMVRLVPTGQTVSHMLAVTADGRRGYTANILPGTVSELVFEEEASPRIFSVAPRVEGIAVTPGGTHVWVGSNEAGTVSIVDTGTGVVVDTLTGFGMPYRIAITPDGRTAVIADPKSAVVRLVNAETRADIATITVPAEGVLETAEFPGSPSPEGIALSRDGRFAYVALQGSSRIAAIDLVRHAIVGYMETGRGPDGIGYSPLTR